MCDFNCGRPATAGTPLSPTSMSWAQLDVYAAQIKQPAYAAPAPHTAPADSSFFRTARTMPSMSRLYGKQPQVAGTVKLRVKQPGQTAPSEQGGASSTKGSSEIDGQSVYTTITTSSTGSSSTRSTIRVYGRGGAARAMPKEPKILQTRKFGSQESLMSECRAPEPDLTPEKTAGKAFIEGFFKSKAAKQADAKGKGKVTITVVGEEGGAQYTKTGWRPPHAGHDTVSMKARASTDTLRTFSTFSSQKSKERVYTYGRGGAGRMAARPSKHCRFAILRPADQISRSAQGHFCRSDSPYRGRREGDSEAAWQIRHPIWQRWSCKDQSLNVRAAYTES